MGDLLMTGAILKGAEDGPGEVLHFAVPLSSPHVKVLDTGRALGMRGTGSHDVLIDGHIVLAAAVSLGRRAGEWHPFFHVVGTVALPLIYAAYLGVAEGARDATLPLARRKPTTHTVTLMGRLDTELMATRLAHGAMVAVAEEGTASADTVTRVMMGRSLVARHALAVGELALEAAGDPGFYRSAGLERRFRDLQGVRYHPMQAGPQAEYAGRMALGMPVDRVF